MGWFLWKAVRWPGRGDLREREAAAGQSPDGSGPTDEDRGPKPPSPDRLSFKAAALAIGLLAGLAIAELLARLVLTDFYQCDQDLGWTFVPGQSGIRISRSLRFAGRVRINSAGFRDVEHELAPRAGTVRVLLLGDSMLAGMQVPLDATFTKQFERQLNGHMEEGTRFEVVNCATDGYGTAQEWLIYRSRCHRYSAGIVILGVFLYNDLLDNYRAAGTPNHALAHRCGRPYFSLRDGVLVQANEAEREGENLSPWLDRHLRRSYLYQVIFPVYAGRDAVPALLNRDLYSADHRQALESAWEITRQLLVALERDVASSGARLVPLLMPVRYEVHPSWALEDWGSIEGIEFERPYRLAKGYLEGGDSAHIDLYPAFKAYVEGSTAEPFYRRDSHLNGEGNRLAADVAARWLTTNCAVLGLPPGHCARAARGAGEGGASLPQVLPAQ